MTQYNRSKEHTYKGHPTLELPFAEGGRSVILGLRKIRAVIENLADARAFVAKYSEGKGAK